MWGPAARSRRPYVKDAFHRRLVEGEDCVSPDELGTKACVDYRAVVPAGGSWTLRLRLTPGRLAQGAHLSHLGGHAEERGQAKH